MYAVTDNPGSLRTREPVGEPTLFSFASTRGKPQSKRLSGRPVLVGWPILMKLGVLKNLDARDLVAEGIHERAHHKPDMGCAEA